MAVPFKSIVYGNTAEQLPKTATSSHTHAWRLYVRGANNEDLRPLVARVVFKLHESFQQPTRGLVFSGASSAVCLPGPMPTSRLARQWWKSRRTRLPSLAGANST